MNIKIMNSNTIFEQADLNEKYMGMMDRYFLMRAHPRAIVFDSVGVIWSVYFLWNNNWQLALASIFVTGIFGLYFTRNTNPELLAESTVGRIGLLHTHPINLALNILGIVPLVSGIWTHKVETILLGVSIIIFGHFFGWSKVNPRLRV